MIRTNQELSRLLWMPNNEPVQSNLYRDTILQRVVQQTTYQDTLMDIFLLSG